ncbi:hypothetical protein ACFWWT_30110 [Streptomyces sp. NPDC058676]|uniref:hypothetical protein n=1 Tax=unclassified Streptomyces TaxID=2593676 RepID=UPI0036689695
MSADRETNSDMTNSDIAVLLADATDEVEIGIAPYQAVIRGGRRRRARRWAVAAATTLVLAGSSATLAAAGLQGGDEEPVRPLATHPVPSPNVFDAKRTTLATGTENGQAWKVLIDVWPAPRDEVEAQGELDAMTEYGDRPVDVDKASDLVGKGAFFVHRHAGDKDLTVLQDLITAEDGMSGTDLQAAALPLTSNSEDPERLVIGQVAKTAQQVTCTWKDGTTTKVTKPAPSEEVNTETSAIRTAEGSPVNWFVCLAPKGTAYKSVAVTG